MGNKVNIWKDNWLPQNNGYKILTPKANHIPTMVSDLIVNQPSTSWNSALIDSVFIPFEGDFITQLPLTQEPMEDQLMWPHTSDGCYTVKSGYYLLKHWQDSNTNGTTNSTLTISFGNGSGPSTLFLGTKLFFGGL
jgi:hypothetical protein